jgi:hypothetical protein
MSYRQGRVTQIIDFTFALPSKASPIENMNLPKVEGQINKGDNFISIMQRSNIELEVCML